MVAAVVKTKASFYLVSLSSVMCRTLKRRAHHKVFIHPSLDSLVLCPSVWNWRNALQHLSNCDQPENATNSSHTFIS